MLNLLPQGCPKEFVSVMDRKKHLLDSHAYPSKYAFDRLHLGGKKAQQRPLPEFQRAGKKQSSRDSDAMVMRRPSVAD